MWHGNLHGWGMGLGWIVGLAILGIIIWLVIRVVNQNPSQKQTDRGSALDILKERYARGEINKEEYEEKKKDIL